MLKPNQINPAAPDPLREVTDLEHQFDKAIQDAAASGKWPATIGQYRDGIKPEIVDAVAKQYRDAGWIVHTHYSGMRAVIDHPDRPQGMEDRAVLRAKCEGVIR